MKNIIKRTGLYLLCFIMATLSVSCSKTEAAMKLNNATVSGQIYAYYLACYKQYWLTALSQTDSKEFWGAETDGIKNSERLTQISEDAIKKRLASNCLFDEFGLKLTDEEYNSINMMIAGIKASVDGEKGIEEDEVFKALGMDSDDLKSVLIMDSKVGALQDFLYGDEGERKITDQKKEDYYQKNYYRFRLLYLMDGDFVRDENGNIVYSEGGGAQVKEISDERYEEKLDFAKEILSAIRAGDDINEYIEQYSEQLEKDDYKNGHYLCSVNEYGSLISAAVMKLGIGEAGLLDTKYGIYVIQRIELDPYAWGNKENEAGNDFYNFDTLVLEDDFDGYIKPYVDKIETVVSVTEKYKIEDLPYTFSWQYIF